MAKCSSAPGREFFFSNTDVNATSEKCQSQLSATKSCSRVAGAGPALQHRVNRVHQAQRFFVRQNRLLHLIHHVGETDPVFRIRKRMTATGAGMAKCLHGLSENGTLGNLTA